MIDALARPVVAFVVRRKLAAAEAALHQATQHHHLALCDPRQSEETRRLLGEARRIAQARVDLYRDFLAGPAPADQ